VAKGSSEIFLCFFFHDHAGKLYAEVSASKPVPSSNEEAGTAETNRREGEAEAAATAKHLPIHSD